MFIRFRGSDITEPLPSNDWGYTYRHTCWLEGFMNYAFEMGSGAMVYIPSFVKAGWFCHSKFDGVIHRHTDSMVIASAYFYFFKIRKVG
jgi:hypothetical protein